MTTLTASEGIDDLVKDRDGWRKWALRFAVLLAVAIASLFLAGLYISDLRQNRADAAADAVRWKELASKAYTGYLLATAPVGTDGIMLPKGARLEDDATGSMKRVLPPEDFRPDTQTILRIRACHGESDNEKALRLSIQHPNWP